MDLIRLTHAKIINCMSFFVENLCTYSNTHLKTIENSAGARFIKLILEWLKNNCNIIF